MKLEERLDRIYNKYEKNMKSEGMAFLIEDEAGDFRWQRETGQLKENHKFATASVTKLYTTTVVFRLIDEGLFTLDSHISDFLPEKMIKGLHIYKGMDYSQQLTIRHLIAQTSGLPDYFSEAPKGSVSIEKSFMCDRYLSFEEALEITKQLKPHFAPGRSRKAFYSDINFDLLGIILESVTGRTLTDNFVKYIYQPLGLKQTYMFEKGMEFDFPGFFIQDKVYQLPKYLAGWPASGSIISTKTDMVIFLKAFWNGKLFDKSHVEEMKVYHFIQIFPMQYGIGHMQFKYPGFPAIIGHSGATGVVCYYVPEYRIYIAGCINEMNDPKVTRLAMRLVNCFKHE